MVRTFKLPEQQAKEEKQSRLSSNKQQEIWFVSEKRMAEQDYPNSAIPTKTDTQLIVNKSSTIKLRLLMSGISDTWLLHRVAPRLESEGDCLSGVLDRHRTSQSKT